MRVTLARTGHKLRFGTATILYSGGEANIHAVADLDGPEQVAKIYRRPTPERAAKLELMLRRPPEDPQKGTGRSALVWPTDLLHDESGRIVGFLMPRVREMSPLIDFFNPLQRLKQRPHCNYMYLHRLARNFALTVAAVHDRAYTVGDINESNVLGHDTALITLVDNDSFQVIDRERKQVYRCLVGKPEFTPPELQGVPFATVNREPRHDHFGMAVLIFQLLMEGTHPYAGVWQGEGEPPMTAERIRHGLSAYFPRIASAPGSSASTSATTAGRITPAPHAPPLELLPTELRHLFRAAFAPGDTASRPNARAWASALATAEQSLHRCTTNREHHYGNHLDACPWCARRDLFGGIDPFPAPGTARPGLLAEPTAPIPETITVSVPTTVPTTVPMPAAKTVRQRNRPPAPGQSATSFTQALGSRNSWANGYDVETVGETIFTVLLILGAIVFFNRISARHTTDAQQMLMILGATMTIIGALGRLLYRGRAVIDPAQREILVSTGLGGGEMFTWRRIPFACIRGVAVTSTEGEQRPSYQLRVLATGVSGITIKTTDADLSEINRRGRDLAHALGTHFFAGARGTTWQLLGNKVERQSVALRSPSGGGVTLGATEVLNLVRLGIMIIAVVMWLIVTLFGIK